MKYLIIRVESKGCGGCIATAILHLLKIRGVRGARTRGRDIVVVLDESADIKQVLSDPSLNNYYRIIEWTLLDDSIKPHLYFSLVKQNV